MHYILYETHDFILSIFLFLSLQYVGDCYKIIISYYKRFERSEAMILAAVVSVLMQGFASVWF